MNKLIFDHIAKASPGLYTDILPVEVAIQAPHTGCVCITETEDYVKELDYYKQALAMQHNLYNENELDKAKALNKVYMLPLLHMNIFIYIYIIFYPY